MQLAYSIPTQANELTYKVTQVADGILMLSGDHGFTGGNIAVSIGDDGVVMIDNGLASTGDLLQAALAQVTTQNIDLLINTHVHSDHTGNNATYAKHHAHIISHHNVRRALSQQKHAPNSLPALTYSEQMSLHLNGDTANIIHFANAHTDGDSMVHFVQKNVIHTGDLYFQGTFPFIDANNGGSLQGAINALKTIYELSDDNTKIIPGHGELVNKDSLAKDIAMLETSLATVSAMVAQDKTDAQIAAAKPLAAYSNYAWSFIDTSKMLAQVIRAARDGH